MDNYGRPLLDRNALTPKDYELLILATAERRILIPFVSDRRTPNTATETEPAHASIF